MTTAVLDIACEDCSGIVRWLRGQPPKSCPCGAMTVDKRIARYAPRGAPPEDAPRIAEPPYAGFVASTHPTLDCVDDDGQPRVAPVVAMLSGQGNEFVWTPSMSGALW